jgi:hypothetical protein
VRRAGAALSLAALSFTALLSGCVQNLPVAAVDWLAGQDGIGEATVLSDDTGAWSSSGLVHGELEPGLSDVHLGDLLERIGDYSDEHGGVGFWLGSDGIDFVVTDDNAATISLWKRVSEVPGLVSGVVADHDIRVRAMRADAAAAFDALDRIEGGVRLEAFADEAALAADALLDLRYDRPNLSAIEYRRAGDCTPDPAVRTIVDDLLSRDDIPGATADLCAGITIDIVAGDSVATQALGFRADLDERGLSQFPVQLTSDVDGSGTIHFAAITPGDPALLPVLAVFDQPDAPPVSYSLGPDGSLAVTAYDIPTTELLMLVQGSPAASKLAGVGLEGDPVAIVAPLERLPALLDEALALDAASYDFGSVQLGPGFGTVTLQAEAGARPDVTGAAEALRASGAADRRFFSVRYAAFQADIVDGVAALSDPDYVGADVMQAFVDAWNG